MTPSELALNAAILAHFPVHDGPLPLSTHTTELVLTHFDIWSTGLEKLIDYLKAHAPKESSVLTWQGAPLVPVADRREMWRICFVEVAQK